MRSDIFQFALAAFLQQEGLSPLLGWEGAVEALSDRAKEEIRLDVAEGIIPPTAGSFAQLHDWTDANAYGGAFRWPGPWPGDADDPLYLDTLWSFWGTIQDRVDTWLRTGGARKNGKG